MPIAHVNNCDFYYEVKGNGPDVVFIHGEDHGIEMFEPQVAHLSPHYRCVTYYRRGHGRSQLTPYGYSLRNQILDLAMLLEKLEIDRAVLLLGWPWPPPLLRVTRSSIQAACEAWCLRPGTSSTAIR
jgi:pimeloyl-ACP methyl ester carboxylesterase